MNAGTIVAIAIWGITLGGTLVFGPAEVYVPNLTNVVRVGAHAGYVYFTEMGLDDGSMSGLSRRRRRQGASALPRQHRHGSLPR